MRELAKAYANEMNETQVLYLVESNFFRFTSMTYAVKHGIEYVEEIHPDKVEVSIIEQMQSDDVL